MTLKHPWLQATIGRSHSRVGLAVTAVNVDLKAVVYDLSRNLIGDEAENSLNLSRHELFHGPTLDANGVVVVLIKT